MPAVPIVESLYGMLTTANFFFNGNVFYIARRAKLAWLLYLCNVEYFSIRRKTIAQFIISDVIRRAKTDLRRCGQALVTTWGYTFVIATFDDLIVNTRSQIT